MIVRQVTVREVTVRQVAADEWWLMGGGFNIYILEIQIVDIESSGEIKGLQCRVPTVFLWSESRNGLYLPGTGQITISQLSGAIQWYCRRSFLVSTLRTLNRGWIKIQSFLLVSYRLYTQSLDILALRSPKHVSSPADFILIKTPPLFYT